MSAFISRLLVVFYIVFLPVFLGLYVAAMFSPYPKQAALWIEGGASEYGPAAFIVLLALWIFPLLFSFLKYLVAGDSSDLARVLVISAILSVYPAIGAIQAHLLGQNFPVQVISIAWANLDLLGGIFLLVFLFALPIGGLINRVYRLHAISSSKETKRKCLAELSARFRVKAEEIEQLLAALVANEKQKTWRGESAATIESQYLSRHLALFSKARLSVDAYLSFVDRAVGRDHWLNESAFVELDRHLQSFSEAGGMELHFRWLDSMSSRSLCDDSFSLYPGRGYALNKISLSDALVEFKLGEFSTPDEYLEFAKTRPSYVTLAERQPFEKELEMMSHPVLQKMFAVGGAHRARALQIVRRSQIAAKAEKTRAIFPDAGITAAPTPPQVALMDLAMISRGGQIILRDIKLQNLPTMVMQGQVLMSDHYWCQGMSGWASVSTYRNSEAPHRVSEVGANWSEVFTDFFLSWLLYILGGVLIAALIGYGNGGMSGVGSAIGGFLGFIILVRPVTFLFRIIFRLAIGKRGMELFR